MFSDFRNNLLPVKHITPAPNKKNLTQISRAMAIKTCAEGEGFEPSDPRKGQRFSRPPHSTTLPPFRKKTLQIYRIEW